MIKNYGIKPLVVRFNHGYKRNVVYENNPNTFKKLGVDVIDFTPNWKIVKLLMKSLLIEKQTFAGIVTPEFSRRPIRTALIHKVL